MATRKLDPALQALIDAGLINSGREDVTTNKTSTSSATGSSGYSKAPRPTTFRQPTSSGGGSSASGFGGGGGGAWGPNTTPPAPTAGVGGGSFKGTAPMTPDSPGSGLEGYQSNQNALNQGLAKNKTTSTNTNTKDVSNWAPTGLGGGEPSQANYANMVNPEGFIDPKLMSGQEMADLFGFIFGRDQILEILQGATNAKFDEWGKQTESLRDQSLTDYSAQYNQYLQNSRQNRQNAVRHGLQRGSSVAQEVLGQLGAQQGGAENQTMYQQQMADIAAQRGSQLAYDEFNALNMQNELAGNIGNMAVGQYSNEVQQQAAQMSHHGQLVSADAQIKSAEIAAAGQRAYANAMAQAQVQAAQIGANATAAQEAGYDAGTQFLIDQGFDPVIAWSMARGVLDYQGGLDRQAEINAKDAPPNYASNKIANWLGNTFGVMPR